MKAIGKLHPQKGLWLYDAPMPAMGPNDLLIKVQQTSLCGTDLHIYNWDEWAAKTVPIPLTTGHEFFGTVAATGANTKGFSVGDRVTAEGHIICGQCHNCRSGAYHLCTHTKGIGVTIPGCFAEYVVVPAFNAISLPNFISDDVATILDPFGNAVHTALSFNLVGEDVLITGAGPIGIMALVIAQKIGARTIVITDINDERLKMAQKMGASHAVNTAKHSLNDVMQELCIADGFTVGFEMSGSQKALDEMIDKLACGAKLALLGILPQKTVVDGPKIVFKSLELLGIYGREMFGTWQKAFSLIQEGVDISPLITHKFTADNFEDAFTTMVHGNCGKIILTWP